MIPHYKSQRFLSVLLIFACVLCYSLTLQSQEDVRTVPPMRITSDHQPRCDANLVSDAKEVPDSAFSASSVRHNRPEFAPSRARMKSFFGSDDSVSGGSAGQAWCPQMPITANSDSTEWIQVDFTGLKIVTEVFTRGLGSGNYLQEFISNFVLEYQREVNGSSSTWKSYRVNHNSLKIFPGNTDSRNTVRHKLNPPLILRRLRIRPIETLPDTSRSVCLRFALQGCDFPDGVLSYSYNGDMYADDRTYYDGLGRLMDNKITAILKKPEQNAEDLRKMGFVTWYRSTVATGLTPNVVIVFRFDTVRNFTQVRLHGPPKTFRDGGIEVRFSVGGVVFDRQLAITMSWDDEDRGSTADTQMVWHVVTLQGRVAQFVQLTLFFPKNNAWMALDEVQFFSQKVLQPVPEETKSASSGKAIDVSVPIVPPSSEPGGKMRFWSTTKLQPSAVPSVSVITLTTAGSYSSQTELLPHTDTVSSTSILSILVYLSASVLLLGVVVIIGYFILRRRRGLSPVNKTTSLIFSSTSSSSPRGGPGSVPPMPTAPPLLPSHNNLTMQHYFVPASTPSMGFPFHPEGAAPGYYHPYLAGVPSNPPFYHHPHHGVLPPPPQLDFPLLRPYQIPLLRSATTEPASVYTDVASVVNGSTSDEENEEDNAIDENLRPKQKHVYHDPDTLMASRETLPHPLSITNYHASHTDSPTSGGNNRIYPILTPHKSSGNLRKSPTNIGEEQGGGQCRTTDLQGPTGGHLYAASSAVSAPEISTWPSILANRIHLLNLLGVGRFGETHLAKMATGDGNTRLAIVTVKMLRVNVDAHVRKEFLEEVQLLHSLQHRHLTTFLGLVSHTSSGESFLLWAVMEHGLLGDLHTFLCRRCPAPADMAILEHTPHTSSLQRRLWTEFQRDVKHNPTPGISYACLVHMAFQVSQALAFLESLGVAHRDVACRNCFLSENFEVKLGNVSMAAAANLGEDVYCRMPVGDASVWWPVRWMAPESLITGVFSSKSDVWSFAVCLWEMFSLCRYPPYPECRHSHELLEQVVSSTKRNNMGLGVPRLERPLGCSKELFDLMLECWNWQPTLRPCFGDVVLFLQRKAGGFQPREEYQMMMRSATPGT